MDAVFLKIVNMALSAGWLIGAVLILRLILKRCNAPKWLICGLWVLVAVRLVCPVSPESAFSLVPSADPLPPEILEGPVEHWSPDPAPGDPIQGAAPEIEDSEGGTVSSTKAVYLMGGLTTLWLVGVGVMLGCALWSYLRLRKQVAPSVEEDGVWLCDHLPSPFILGLVRPRIYLPSHLTGPARAAVVAHERAHLARRDHWWKPFGFLLLTLYWFHPLVWAAYLLLCRDIESACDEKVVRDMDLSARKDYSNALLDLSLPRRQITACPLAFGEVGVKERVKNVLNYKKPAFWVVLGAIAAVVIVAVCFLTDPKTPDPEEPYAITDEGAVQWLDYREDPAGMPNTERRCTLPEYPEYTFVWTQDKVWFENQWGNCILLSGMPVYSVYFADLNGDGFREVCANVGFGSGMIDERIEVCDLANDQTNTLSDRGKYDYNLVLENGVMMAQKYAYPKHERDTPLESGILYLEHGTLAAEMAEPQRDLDVAIFTAVRNHFRGAFPAGIEVESHHIFGQMELCGVPKEGNSDWCGQTVVYALVLYERYVYGPDDLKVAGGSCVPTILTFDEHTDGTLTLAEYWEPGDGDSYNKDLEERFPEEYRKELEPENWNKLVEILKQRNLSRARSLSARFYPPKS